MKWFVFVCIAFSLIQCDQASFLDAYRRGASLPPVNLLLLDSVSVIKIDEQPRENPVLLLFIDPYCPYCQSETRSILGNMDKFEKVQIYLISISSLNDVSSFSKRLGVEKFPNVHIGVDTAAAYVRYFDVKRVPHASLYSKSHRLEAVFPGYTDGSKIASLIR